ncbi:MAG: glycosyltransferase [Deltaproteobacteria bacterium]|jgi:D-inositol-3-phosphate glycosyltransferase|nr:glycosyltransferase [Deltaproteobacteria bacterium]MBW2534182.1 glycosyltransferase [Deltaproteobacteria bacterium]
MRIVWVSPHCWPDYVLRADGLGKKSQGGQTIVMYYCTLALADAYPDLEIDIYCRFEDGEQEVTEIHPRVRIIRLPLGPTDEYFPKEKFWGPIDEFNERCVKWAADHGVKYDLVHGHYADGWHSAYQMAKAWKVPYLCSTHSLGIRKRDNALRMKEATPEELDAKYNFTVRIEHEQRALDHADRYCPLTIEEGEYMAEKYGIPKDKIRVTNNGVIEEDFWPENEAEAKKLKQELGLTDNDVPILLIARVEPREGQAQLIEAAPEVIRRVKERSGRDVKILFVAWVDTPYAKQLEARVEELGIRDNVIYHPPVLNKEIPKFFWASAAYSLSSTYDIFPIVMLEAMASGLPIVATKNGGPSEVLTPGEDGYLVETTDKQELADALVKVVGDEEERKRLGGNAHQKVVERYTWPKIAERCMSIYRELVPEG